MLASYFRQRFAQEQHVETPELPPALLARMLEYPWPGNVRELEGFMERAVILHQAGEALNFEHLTGAPTDITAGALLDSASGARWSMERLEREYILSVLAQQHGRKSQAVRILGISRRTLYRKLARYREEGHLVDDGAED
jgi:DNA-binding NtrC family response regulator